MKIIQNGMLHKPIHLFDFHCTKCGSIFQAYSNECKLKRTYWFGEKDYVHDCPICGKKNLNYCGMDGLRIEYYG